VVNCLLTASAWLSTKVPMQWTTQIVPTFLYRWKISNLNRHRTVAESPLSNIFFAYGGQFIDIWTFIRRTRHSIRCKHCVTDTTFTKMADFLSEFSNGVLQNSLFDLKYSISIRDFWLWVWIHRFETRRWVGTAIIFVFWLQNK